MFISDLSPEELRHVREKMDMTDAQLEQLKAASANYPKTAKAVETFGEVLKKLGLPEEHHIKIARALGAVIETASAEASEKAWAVVDGHLEKMREIIDTPGPGVPLECPCPSIDGSGEIDPFDMAGHAEEWRDRVDQEGDKP